MTPVLDGAHPVTTNFDALGGIEINQIPRGFIAADALVKKAAARVIFAAPVTPGKFFLLMDGEVADVEESLLEAEAVAAEQLIDRFLLPYAHRAITPAIFGSYPDPMDGAIGIVETATSCFGIRCLDTALKAAPVAVTTLHLSLGIGGKCYWAIRGDLYDVQASLGAVQDIGGRAGHLLASEIIASPHRDFLKAIGLQ